MLTPLEATAIATTVTAGPLGFVIGLRANDIRGIGWLHGTWTEVHPRELAEQIRTGQLKLKNLDKRTRAIVLAEMARQANGITADESAQFLALDGVAARYTHVAPPAGHPSAAYDYRRAA